jgi:hypothetical protein
MLGLEVFRVAFVKDSVRLPVSRAAEPRYEPTNWPLSQADQPLYLC